MKKVNYIKLRIEFDNHPGKPFNVEILIQDSESFFRERYETGTYIPSLDDVTGPAHGPFAIARENAIKPFYVPQEIYPGLYGQPSRPTPVQQETSMLRKRNRL